MGINTTINVITIFILVGVYKSQENKVTIIWDNITYIHVHVCVFINYNVYIKT